MSVHLRCSSVKGDNNALSVKLLGRPNVIKHVRACAPFGMFYEDKMP